MVTFPTGAIPPTLVAANNPLLDNKINATALDVRTYPENYFGAQVRGTVGEKAAVFFWATISNKTAWPSSVQRSELTLVGYGEAEVPAAGTVLVRGNQALTVNSSVNPPSGTLMVVEAVSPPPTGGRATPPTGPLTFGSQTRGIQLKPVLNV